MNSPKNERKIGELVSVIVLLLLVIYLGYLSYNVLFYTSKQTVTAVREKLTETCFAKGIIIFEQNIYPLSGNNVKFFVKEGERVSKGTALFSSGFQPSDELTRISALINQAEGKTRDYYFSTIDGLREAFLKDDYESIKTILNSVNFSDTSVYFRSVNLNENQLNLDELKAKKEKLEIEEKNISKEKTVISNMSGVISLKPSKLNQSLLQKYMETLTTENFESIIKSGTSSQELRVVDNFQATLILKLKEEDFEQEIKPGRVLLLENKDVGFFQGTVKEVRKQDGKLLIFLTIVNELHRFLNLEYGDFSIVKFEKEAFKLPKESIIKNGLRIGVFIDYKGSIVRYVPVEILKENENYVYVSTGENGRITEPITKEAVYTLAQYDEVFLHPEKLKEDEILE